MLTIPSHPHFSIIVILFVSLTTQCPLILFLLVVYILFFCCNLKQLKCLVETLCFSRHSFRKLLIMINLCLTQVPLIMFLWQMCWMLKLCLQICLNIIFFAQVVLWNLHMPNFMSYFFLFFLWYIHVVCLMCCYMFCCLLEGQRFWWGCIQGHGKGYQQNCHDCRIDQGTSFFSACKYYLGVDSSCLLL